MPNNWRHHHFLNKDLSVQRAHLCADDEVLWVWLNAEWEPLQRRVEAAKWKHQSNCCDCYESHRTNETHSAGVEVVQPRNNTTIRYVQAQPAFLKESSGCDYRSCSMDENWSHTRREDNSWINRICKEEQGSGIIKLLSEEMQLFSASAWVKWAKLHENNLQEGAETLGSHSNQIILLILTDFAGCL